MLFCILVFCICSFFFLLKIRIFIRQEDAQEFLSFIMHQMHDELLKLEGQISICNGERTSLVSSINDDDDDDYWETVGPKNKTAITRTQSFIPSKLSVIFGGQLRSVVKARGKTTLQPMLLPRSFYPIARYWSLMNSFLVFLVEVRLHWNLLCLTMLSSKSILCRFA